MPVNSAEQSASFYTSDWEETYVATLKGYDENGKMWERKALFTVK